MTSINAGVFINILLLFLISISYCRKTEYEYSHTVTTKKYKYSLLMLSVFSNFANRDESVTKWLDHTTEDCKNVNVYKTLIKQKRKVDQNFYYASNRRLKFILIEFYASVYNAFLECKVIPEELKKAIIQFDEVSDLLYRKDNKISKKEKIEKIEKKCKNFFKLKNLEKTFLNIEDLFKQKILSRKDKVKRIVLISMILMRNLNKFNKLCWSQK